MITERAIPLEEARNSYKTLISNNTINKDFGNFRVIEKETNRFVGLAKLELKSSDSKEAELGYMLLPEFWGKGGYYSSIKGKTS